MAANFLSLDDFTEQFINIDFDNYLIEQNNNLVNSNDIYLLYKNEYIKITKENYNKLSLLLKQYISLNNNYIITDNNKYIYHYIDNNEHKNLNIIIKDLIISQKKSLDNFINYITFLNSCGANTIINTVVGKSRMMKISKK